MAAAKETLHQSTDGDTTNADVQMVNLHFRLMKLQNEIKTNGINVVHMKATFDKLYSISDRLPPTAQIAQCPPGQARWDAHWDAG